MTSTIPMNASASDYFASEGLSQSGLKDLAISPYRYWYLNINPDRPERKETPEMRFGSALSRPQISRPTKARSAFWLRIGIGSKEPPIHSCLSYGWQNYWIMERPKSACRRVTKRLACC
jgi:hypothetical protein